MAHGFSRGGLDEYDEHGNEHFKFPNALKMPPISERGNFGEVVGFFGNAKSLADAVTAPQWEHYWPLAGVSHMLVTLIRDAYKQGEEQGVATALDELCSPKDSLGWASAGVYVFWDFATSNVLYIGLAVDLAQRFRQHNGLLPCEPNGCKKEKIKAYFATQQTLGYSIFVQSPLDQPITAKVAKMFMDFDIGEKHDYPSEAGRDVTLQPPAKAPARKCEDR